MKTKTITLYEYDELDGPAKERAYDDYRINFDYPFFDDNRASLDVFSEKVGAKYVDFSYGANGPVYCDYKIDLPDEVLSLNGIRLRTWIVNNYWDMLYNPKYIGSINADKPISHSRVKSVKLSNGRYYNPYYSAITKESSCNLTGYHMDFPLLLPFYNFINHNYHDNKINLSDLFDESFYGWVKKCDEDFDYMLSEEFFKEECSVNDWSFDEDGEIYYS